jgi:hypothetical protein
MNPTFDDPDLAAVYRYLIDGGEPPAPGQRPTPANMPRRALRPRTAADIARLEGLDLGDVPGPRRPTRPRKPAAAVRPSAFRQVFEYIAASGCSRPEASELAHRWLQTEQFLDGVRQWAGAVGVRHPHIARELLKHGVDVNDLDVLIDGTSARRRLRNGEPVGQIIAALLAARRPA